MKAYFLSIRDDDMQQGGFTVFADTVQEARKQVYKKGLDVENWIDVQAHRDKKFDGLENLTPAELANRQWREGWQWYDIEFPHEEDTTDEEFYIWYEKEFKEA